MDNGISWRCIAEPCAEVSRNAAAGKDYIVKIDEGSTGTTACVDVQSQLLVQRFCENPAYVRLALAILLNVQDVCLGPEGRWVPTRDLFVGQQ